MKTPKGFFTYFHHEAVLGALNDEQAGQLYKALLHYGNTGELPDFGDDAASNVAFTLFRTEIDYNFARYQEICEKRKEAGKKGGRPKKQQDESSTSASVPDEQAKEDPFIKGFLRLRQQHDESTSLAKQ